MSNNEPEVVSRSSRFITIQGSTYESEVGTDEVCITSQRRMYSYSKGYHNTGPKHTVFDGDVKKARLLRQVLDELVPESDWDAERP